MTKVYEVPSGKKLNGCVHFSYNGFTISLTTADHGQVAVWKEGNNKNPILFTVDDDDLNALMQAKQWVDGFNTMKRVMENE